MDRRTWALIVGGICFAACLGVPAAEPQGAADVAGLVDAGKYAEAEAVLTERLRRDPADAEAHYYSGMIPVLTDSPERYDEALVHLRRCVELRPDVSGHHLWLARVSGLKAREAGVFRALGLVHTAKAAYLKALELDPRNAAARHDLLQFYLQAPEIVGGGVAKAWALAAAGEPYDADLACVLRAGIHLHQREYEAAEQALGAVSKDASVVAVGYAREVAQSLASALQGSGPAGQAQGAADRAAGH